MWQQEGPEKLVKTEAPIVQDRLPQIHVYIYCARKLSLSEDSRKLLADQLVRSCGLLVPEADDIAIGFAEDAPGEIQ